MASILISVTNSPSDPTIHKGVCFTTDKLLMDGRYEVSIIRPTWNPYEHSLHRIVKDFVEGKWTHWLNIDSDNPPMNNPLDLVEMDLDIVGLPTPIFKCTNETIENGEFPICWNAWDYVPEVDAYKEHNPQVGLQAVDAIGTGCFLASKRVFLNKELQKGAFHRTYDEHGIVVKGNDIAFCERAKAQGFDVHAHFDYRCRHFNNIELVELYQCMINWKTKGVLNV